MIKIKIFRNEQGNVTGFTVNGHAKTASYGKDIVCAAVSALTQTALLGIGKYLSKEIDYVVAKGNLQIKLLAEPDELSDAVFETMILGLNEIENKNPKSVQILEHGR